MNVLNALVNRDIIVKDDILYPEQNLNEDYHEEHTFIYYQKNHCIMSVFIRLVDDKFYLTGMHKFYKMICKLHNEYVPCQIKYKESSMIDIHIKNGNIIPQSFDEIMAYHHQDIWYNVYYFDRDIESELNHLKKTILKFFKNLTEQEITIERQSLFFPIPITYFIHTTDHMYYLEELNEVLPLFSVNGQLFEYIMKLWKWKP